MSWLEGLSEPDWRECYSDSEVQETARQALNLIDELLKEQEAKNVAWSLGRAHCPTCGELFPKKKDVQYIRFCSYCGQKVEFDG